MSEILNTIRHAIESSDASRYRISKDTGIAQSVLSRFLSGERGLDLATVERLADYLELRVTIEPKNKANKGR